MKKDENIDGFIDNYLGKLSSIEKAKAVAELTRLTEPELTIKDVDYLLTLHNMNISGVHTGGFFDPLVQKGIKAKLQTLKKKLI